ncbi:MAG: DUF1360 domain-containing protein [Patescibacteria group bacterium]
MIRVTDQYFWNFVFSLFFLVIVIMAAIILESESRIPLGELTLVDCVLITLATWRLIRLFVYDAITKFFREQFYDVVKIGKSYELVKPESGPRRTVADLLSCPWCFGVWAAAVVVFFYLITPYTVYPVVFLALSAVATLLQLIANMVGHAAERLKQINEKGV